MQGNEVEAVKTPTVRSWEVYLTKIFSHEGCLNLDYLF
jgi:hypothetical protein